jgi:hypothetical protein
MPRLTRVQDCKSLRGWPCDNGRTTKMDNREQSHLHRNREIRKEDPLGYGTLDGYTFRAGQLAEKLESLTADIKRFLDENPDLDKGKAQGKDAVRESGGHLLPDVPERNVSRLRASSETQIYNDRG